MNTLRRKFNPPDGVVSAHNCPQATLLLHDSGYHPGFSDHRSRNTMTSFFETTRRVEFCETDMAGIVHFSNFYKWMEQAEHEFFRSLGLTIVNHQSDGMTIGWPRVSANCRFESPAKYEDVITVRLTVQRIGVKSLTYDCQFSIEGRPVAKGTMKTVCCTISHGRSLTSLEIPDEYLSKLSEHPAE